MTQNHDPLARAHNSAHEWLASIGSALGTRDRRYTYRVLRAWLHTLRDRLTVESSAHFSAQLPELFRGTYYDGWVPSRVPVRYNTDECLDRIANEAMIRRSDAPGAIAGVSAGMRGLLSDGALDHVLQQLPRDLRALFTAEAAAGTTTASGKTSGKTSAGATTTAPATTGEGQAAGEQLPERLAELQRQVDSLTTVVTSLSRDLRERPGAEGFAGPRMAQDPEAVAAANEILMPRQP
ncbi:DUF2267 domain-containing protein [Saccharomonospora iraqiensis]|uniref:DUF2267 domain-containing protein n=1 Tax=Saccharomonospora iraqiensis TaxID=52698 RepID=UPI00022E1606|nr:DUF2267 domain-containing protein [Saccharomonospora iraqiensis]